MLQEEDAEPDDRNAASGRQNSETAQALTQGAVGGDAGQFGSEHDEAQNVAAPSENITSQATNAAEALYELWTLIAKECNLADAADKTYTVLFSSLIPQDPAGHTQGDACVTLP